MLKAEQIPREAWRAAMAAYYKTLRKDPGMAWQAAVIAAVENWPGVEASEYCPAPYIHLPVTKETGDDAQWTAREVEQPGACAGRRFCDAEEQVMTVRASWQAYFMDMAKQVASRSKDPATQVGCVIVSADKVVTATGYNGIPAGVRDLPERMDRPAKYLWTAHAEENAVALAARSGARLKDATAYVTHAPCARCARSLIQAGVSTVYVGGGTTSMPAEEFDVAAQMFAEASVTVVRLEAA